MNKPINVIFLHKMSTVWYPKVWSYPHTIDSCITPGRIHYTLYMRHFCQLASCISYKCQSFFALIRADLCVISVMTKLANLPHSKHDTLTQCWPTVDDAESTSAHMGLNGLEHYAMLYLLWFSHTPDFESQLFVNYNSISVLCARRVFCEVVKTACLESRRSGI